MIHPADVAGNVPAGAMGIKWGDAAAGSGTLRPTRHGGRNFVYAMNIRAAEAIVSSAPKPMKIFPISEVWSQAVL